MTIKNLSTGKTYPVTKEIYESNFKGKENWLLIDDKPLPKNQSISNTIEETGKKIKLKDSLEDKKPKDDKTQNQNTKK